MSLPQAAGSSQAMPKSVTFARHLEGYEQDLDEMLDMSSSSSSESESDAAAAAAAHDNHTPSARAESGRGGTVTSTYLERNDYKALVESLRTNEQHDTAKHLMTAAMLRRQEMMMPPDKKKKKLRKGWTAWPVPPTQTIHSKDSEDELKAELNALLHATITRRLRAEDKDVSADNLPDDVARMVVSVMLEKLTCLLHHVGSSRSHQGGLADSTINRLDLMDDKHILTISKQTQIVSADVVNRASARCSELFGTDSEIMNHKLVEKKHHGRVKDEEIVQKVAAGPGSWHLRGSKRRKILNGTTDTTDTSGTRFAKNVQPVPRHLLKFEQQD